MSRYKKLGLDYFPLNTDIDSDDKIMMLQAEHGIIAYAIYIKLLAKIYKEYGYYYPWSEREAKLFSCIHHVDIMQLDVYIMYAINEGLFDKVMYTKFRVLTSRGIQVRFFDAVKRRNNIYVYKELLLLDKPLSVKYYENKLEYNGDLCIHHVNSMSTFVHREEKRREEKRRYIVQKSTIIDYLNEKLGSCYRKDSTETERLLDARIDEGYSQDDFFEVIDKKVAEWKGTKQEVYLRPKTLFGSNFESYLNQKVSLGGSKSNFEERELDSDEVQRLNKKLVNAPET